MTKQEEYILSHCCDVFKLTSGTGIFPQTVLGAMLLESSKNGLPGASGLAAKYNNHFGRKTGSDWTGKTVSLDTAEYYGQWVNVKDRFRVYGSAKDGIRDYIDLIAFKPSYFANNVARSKNYREQILRLSQVYATDPEYAKKLTAMADTADRVLTKFNRTAATCKSEKIDMKFLDLAVIGIAVAIGGFVMYSSQKDKRL